MNKYWIATLAIVIILGALLYAFLPGGKKSVMMLNTVPVKQGGIKISVTATGTIEPIKLVEVGTQVSGVISKIYVDFNSVVKAGDILAELDTRLLRSELESSQANLKTKQVELEYQQLNYNRQKSLWEKQAISKSDWETAESLYLTAKLSVTSQQASVLKSQTNLGYATIKSTIDGVVISRAVEEGQTVAASFSTPTLFTIANDLTKMRVIANVDEADIGGIKEGQRVVFTVDAYPNDQFDGKVVQVRLEAKTSSNVVTYEVVIDAPNPDLKLKPGLTASANIYTLEEVGLLLMPSKALRFQPEAELLVGIEGLVIENPIAVEGEKEQKAVWVQSGNSLQQKLVTLGATDGVNVEVKSGLQVGDVVVIGVSEQLATGVSGVAPAGNGETSPFMPQPPGGNKKKGPNNDK